DAERIDVPACYHHRHRVLRVVLMAETLPTSRNLGVKVLGHLESELGFRPRIGRAGVTPLLDIRRIEYARGQLKTGKLRRVVGQLRVERGEQHTEADVPAGRDR